MSLNVFSIQCEWLTKLGTLEAKFQDYRLHGLVPHLLWGKQPSIACFLSRFRQLRLHTWSEAELIYLPLQAPHAVVSLFSGCGGLELGARELGAQRLHTHCDTMSG